jgi:hypothetical protein
MLQMDTYFLEMLYLQVLCINVYCLQMKEKSSASTPIGILHLVKIIGLCCKQQKTLSTRFCSSTYIIKSNNSIYK